MMWILRVDYRVIQNSAETLTELLIIVANTNKSHAGEIARVADWRTYSWKAEDVCDFDVDCFMKETKS